MISLWVFGWVGIGVVVVAFFRGSVVARHAGDVGSDDEWAE
jgi:hypothetical protein